MPWNGAFGYPDLASINSQSMAELEAAFDAADEELEKAQTVFNAAGSQSWWITR